MVKIICLRGVLKTDRVTIIQLGLVLNIILFAALAYALRSLWVRVCALEQERAGVSQERATVTPERAAVPQGSAAVSQEKTNVSQGRISEKEVSAGSVSPQLIAVITGAIAAYLDDEHMERHSISSIIQLAD